MCVSGAATLALAIELTLLHQSYFNCISITTDMITVIVTYCSNRCKVLHLLLFPQLLFKVA